MQQRLSLSVYVFPETISLFIAKPAKCIRDYTVRYPLLSVLPVHSIYTGIGSHLIQFNNRHCPKAAYRNPDVDEQARGEESKKSLRKCEKETLRRTTLQIITISNSKGNQYNGCGKEVHYKHIVSRVLGQSLWLLKPLLGRNIQHSEKIIHRIKSD